MNIRQISLILVACVFVSSHIFSEEVIVNVIDNKKLPVLVEPVIPIQNGTNVILALADNAGTAVNSLPPTYIKKSM